MASISRKTPAKRAGFQLYYLPSPAWLAECNFQFPTLLSEYRLLYSGNGVGKQVIELETGLQPRRWTWEKQCVAAAEHLWEHWLERLKMPTMGTAWVAACGRTSSRMSVLITSLLALQSGPAEPIPV